MATIIPFFIPHEGCPHICSFCNQRHTRRETTQPPGAEALAGEIDAWLARLRPERRKASVQVAFYGGSFTALPESRQRELLNAVQPYLASGRIQGIRLSTRPDAITPDGLRMLRRHGVTLVELGVQSLDDSVLAQNGRGHTSAHSLRASALIRRAGLQLGWQLMIGLPGEGLAGIRRMTAACIRMRPDCVRIYPLLVLRGSALEGQWQRGRFQPLSLERAVCLAAFMKRRFDARGLRVIRMGLQASTALEEGLVAGPYHPAFGELVRARIMLAEARKLLNGLAEGQRAVLSVAPADLSLLTGRKQAGLRQLEALGLRSRFTLTCDPGLPRQGLRLDAISPVTS